jgi:hypothetical protein
MEVRARIATEVASIIEGLAELYLLSCCQHAAGELSNMEADTPLLASEWQGLDA